MQKIWENKIVICMQEGNIQYLQFKRLLEYPEITHCYTLRSENRLDFPPLYKDEKKYRESCQKICEALNKNVQANLEVDNQVSDGEENSLKEMQKEELLNSNRIIKPHQTHTDNVKIVEKVEELEGIDGLLTDQKGLILLTTSADCISLLFYDPIQKVIGSVHSGWRGTLAGICKKAVEQMINYYGSNPKDIICGICPSIRKCHFEVDEEVKDLFYQQYQSLEEIDQIVQKTQIKEGKQKYVIDTVEINKILLKQLRAKRGKHFR